MTELLATCTNPKCGAIFSVESFFRRMFLQTLKIDNVTTTCIKCGERAVVGDGEYVHQGNTVVLSAGPPKTKKSIAQVKALMQKLKTEEKIEKEKVIAELQTISPAIASISSEIADKTNYKEWTNLIIALLGLLIAIQQGFFKKDDSSDIKREYIDHLLKENAELKQNQREKNVLQKIIKPVKKPLSAHKAQHNTQVGRNAACPCGSGKKFKRCHGLNGNSSHPNRTLAR